ncbi:MAG: AsmA family protein [Candidatus Omnitrophica bacterium]|nr:AsmA family protein [Candidatus Omnitrophota bacterium]
MKKIFAILFFLLIALFIGLAVYLLTLDVNKYKPILTERIGHAINKDVRLGNISFSVFPPVSVSANSISIKDIEKTWDDVFIEAGSLNARVKILPLLRKNLEIEHLSIRDMDVSLGHGIKFGMPEAILRNISIYGPINIDARLSIFGRGAENTKVKALLYPEAETKKPFIKNLQLEIDISKIDLASVLEALGQDEVAREFSGKKLGGELAITSEKLYLDLGKIHNSAIYMDLSKGAIEAPFIKDGLKDVNLKAQMKEKGVIIERLTGEVAGGNLSADGWVKDVFSFQDWGFDLALKNIDISRILPDPGVGRPGFEGGLDITMDVTGAGFSQDKLLASLTGKGNVSLYNSVLKNMNLLETALNKLDMLPGIVSELKQNLPSYYKDILRKKDTAFKPIDAKFELREGKLIFKDVVIESDAFYLKGDATLGLDRILKVQANLFVPKDLSEAFREVAHEFGYLQNSQGMITMPLMVYGKLPDVNVMPDMDYVIQRLAVSKGQELLESIFRKDKPADSDVEGEVSEDGSITPPEEKQEQRKPEPEEVLLKTIFDIISGPKE